MLLNSTELYVQQWVNCCGNFRTAFLMSVRTRRGVDVS
jgi:hypothetical protein